MPGLFIWCLTSVYGPRIHAASLLHFSFVQEVFCHERQQKCRKG